MLLTKSTVVPEAMTIFRESDKCIFDRKLSERNPVIWGEPKEPDRETHERAVVYQSDTTKVIDRLNIMGFTIRRIKEDFKAIRAQKLEELQHGAEENQELDWFVDEWKFVKKLTFDEYAEGLRKVMDDKLVFWFLEKEDENQLDPLTKYIVLDDEHEDFELGFFASDIRSLLRLACELAAPNSEVVQDITEVVHAGYYVEDEPVCRKSIESLTERHTENSLRIILTEGSTDVEILREGLALLYPHLAEYYSFLDIASFRSQGGAGSLVAIVKAFAAAGITNRIIAIFDNDAAAFDARRSLTAIKLPSNISICNYPNLDLLKSYPTIGPGGRVELDVNGRAASIELYLGEDVLTNGDGKFPVQWKGFVEKLNKYQGEVMHKETIHEALQKKLKRCRTSQSEMIAADWQGLRAIFDVIFHAFD
ncbi:MAG: HEPN/Toprim-associated domain-containing protein [Actinobacteria bacterium]|nr:HEPN/Toprim-associated domain-containing protein [Actinomycetota bacterium]